MKTIFTLFAIMFFVQIIYAQTTIQVPSQYATIQQAIDAANNGDIVLVADGLYYENINFKGKAITVASHFLIDGLISHIENTIINGSQPTYPDSASVVTFRNGEDTTSILYGFKITGGTGTIVTHHSQGVRRIGGGICIYHSGPKIQFNIIEFNSINFIGDAWGGGVSAYSFGSHNIIIENNVIRNNSINTPTVLNYSLGGGIYTLINVGLVRIKNNRIISNTITAPSAWGGGTESVGPGSNNYFLINNLIANNTVNAPVGGSGGMDLIGNNPVVKNNLIVFNSAINGGGVTIEGASPIFVNNTVAFNSATFSGGGIDIIGSTPVLMNCIIWGNNAPTGPQLTGSANVQYSNVQEGYTGTGNINLDPLFDTGSEFYLLTLNSPCKDAGNPDTQYNDLENPLNPGNALWPALGNLRNDMGHFGGPTSLWSYWDWPLPVELTSFTANSNGKEVLLSWTTATEVNNYGFEVQRSTDQKDFLTVGFVSGHGTTTEQQNYSYTDKNLLDGKNYYRLKQIDYGGSFEYSDVIEVEWRAFNTYLLEQNFPNPFNPLTTIGYGIKEKGNVKMTVVNAIGEEVAVLVNEEKKAGYHTVEFNASTLPSGVYFYQLKVGVYSAVKKMILVK